MDFSFLGNKLAFWIQNGVIYAVILRKANQWATTVFAIITSELSISPLLSVTIGPLITKAAWSSFFLFLFPLQFFSFSIFLSRVTTLVMLHFTSSSSFHVFFHRPFCAPTKRTSLLFLTGFVHALLHHTTSSFSFTYLLCPYCLLCFEEPDTFPSHKIRPSLIYHTTTATSTFTSFLVL